MKQTKCIQCKNWVDGYLQNCSVCGAVLNEVYVKEKEVLKKAKGMEFPLIPIHDNDIFFVKAFKRIFRIGQLIFFAIISVIAAISASTVH